MIFTNTHGRGVDLVLNSLSSDLFKASVRCLAESGRFLEIGKMDLMARTLIDSHMFLKDCSFHGIFLDHLLEKQKDSIYVLNRLVKEGK